MALDDLLQAIFSVFHQIHWCMEIAFMIDMITKLFNNDIPNILLGFQ